jgi:PAS domain S-box-containing protein
MIFNNFFCKILILLAVFGYYLAQASDTANTYRWDEFGIPYYRNYTPKEYGGHFQNWSIKQDQNGVILVANNDGLLEYDGVNWRRYSMDGLRSLARDKSGTIYCGTGNHFGYFTHDSSGKLNFKSLSNELDEKYLDFNDVWYTLILDSTVFFITHNYLYRWQNEKISVTETAHSDNIFHTAFTVHNRLFVRQSGVGLMQMKGEVLDLIPDGEIFANSRIYLMEPYDEKTILIGTAGNGFYLFDGKQVTLFPTNTDAYLKENHLYCGTRLSNDYYALGTRLGGVGIMSKKGNLLKIFNDDQGLQDNSVWGMYRDQQGNLWLALNNGITKIEIPSRLSVFSKENGLDGIIERIIRHKGTLYVATNLGIYYLDNSTNTYGWRFPEFERIEGLNEYGWFLYSGNDVLLAGTTGGIYEIEKHKLNKVKGPWASVFEILPSRFHRDLFFLSGRNGVALLKRNGDKWINEGHIPQVTEKVYHVVEEDSITLWLEIANEGVVRVEMLSGSKVPLSKQSVRVSHFNTTHGLPSIRIFPILVGKRLLFSTSQGMFNFDAIHQTFSKIDQFKIPGIWSFLGTEDGAGRLWISAYTNISQEQIYVGTPDKNGSFTWDRSFPDIPDISHINTIYPENKNISWIGTSEGLICYANRFQERDNIKINTLIRRVIMNSDSVIYNGYKQMVVPELEFKNNNLRFEYALASFNRENKNQYQIFLEGFDKKWSKWSLENRKDFTNLPYGDFVFKVRAKDLFDNHGTEAFFKFTILPPWYRTWWAYLAYFLAFVLALFIIDRFQRKRLIISEQHKARLREAEIIREKNIELNETLTTLNATQSQLQSSESRFRSVVQSANEAIISADNKGKIIFWNKHAKVLFGYSKEEVLGKPLTILMPERYHEAHLAGMDRFMNTGETRIMGQIVELTGLRKDGSEFPIELTVAFWEVDDGKFVTGIIRDITKRKQDQEELERTQRQLFQSEKMISIGKLTAGIAHEMNNPIGAIKANTDTTLRSLVKIDEILQKKDKSIHENENYNKLLNLIKQNAQITSTASERISKTIESLKKFTSLDKAEIQSIDLHDSIENTLTLIQHEIGDRVTIKKKYGKLPSVECYPGELNQVFMNLLTNAIQAISDDGTVTIQTSLYNGNVHIQLSDTGAGMTPEEIQELFKPGFSKKGKRVKIGLGLFASHSIIEKHGGKIEVKSEVEKGTTFSITLPLKLPRNITENHD